MSNMSYCRFRNINTDLLDCLEHMEYVDDLSEEEKYARLSMIEKCVMIANDFGYEIYKDEDIDKETK